MTLHRRAITAGQSVIVILILIVAVVAGTYLTVGPAFLTLPTRTTTTTSVSTTETTSAPPIPETLVIDDTNWPVHDLNALYELQNLPRPWWLEHTVYQSLVVTDIKKEFAEGTIEFMPDLATDWTVSADSTTYTYNLRQGVKFSSDNPFNAYQVWTQMYVWYYLRGNLSDFLGALDLFDTSHVVFGPASFELLKASGLANPTGEALAMMQNQTWPIYTAGPYQIVFHTKVPFLYLHGLLVGFEGLLFDCQWALEHGGFGTPNQYNPYFDEHPIPGTGPYVVAEVDMNSHVKFLKNPGYWGNGLTQDEIALNPLLNPGAAKTVIIYAKSDVYTRYTDLTTSGATTGRAQISAIQGSKYWPLVLENPGYAYFSVESPASLTAVAFNTALAPTDNVNLRQAIVHAINYEDVWNTAYFGQAKAFVGPETPNYGEYYNPANLTPYDYNVDKAEEFLAKAGYPNGQGLPTLDFRIKAGCSFCSAAAEVIQSDLAKIGVNVTISEVDASAYYAPYGNYATNKANTAQLGHMSFLGGESWAPSALSPTDYWTSFVTNSSLWGNWAVYSNPTVNDAVSLLAKSGDKAAIIAALKDAQTQIYNDAPYAWIGVVKLWYVDGSFVWERSVIKEVWFDPAYTGMNTAPLFNTVVFA